MKKQLIRISILQSSKILTALYVIIGLFYSLLSIPLIIFGDPQLRLIGFVYLFMPIILAIFCFIGFCILASLYNLLATWLGGIEVEVKDMV